MKPIIIGSNPEVLWPILHEVSGVSRVHFRRHFEFMALGSFTPPLPGGAIVVVEQDQAPLRRRVVRGTHWYSVPHPMCNWYNEPAHRLAVGLLLEELLCR